MERRKLYSPLDEYIKTITETTEYSNKKIQFFDNLRYFYRRKWACSLKSPYFNGVELDLYKLYELVTNRGGWQKVTSNERWTEVLHELSLDEDIQGAEHGLKLIYMRFLSKYEQNELGTDTDEHDGDLISSRSRLKAHSTYVSLNDVPVSLHRSHIPENIGPDYSKIYKSLLSGLPNEVNFALNICTLAAHPGPYLMRLEECPQIISTLVAHCGVFTDECNFLESLYFKDWMGKSGMNFTKFWLSAGIEDEDIKNLLPKFTIDHSEKMNMFEFNIENIVEERMDLKNSTNWRIFQIISILRNLSFEEVNKSVMASDLALLKFLLVCCYTKSQHLIKSAFEILSNISNEIDLTSDGSIFDNHFLLKLLAKEFFSQDKFRMICALEIFSGLCNKKENESLICDFVDERILRQFFLLLTTKDILLCLNILEALYQMSELGRQSCEIICAHFRSVDMFVDLATTDAASFGESGLAGIKVLEMHGTTGQLQPYLRRKPTTFNSSQISNTTTSTNVPAPLSTPAPNPPNPLAAVGSLNKFSSPLNLNNTRPSSTFVPPPQSPLALHQQRSNTPFNQVITTPSISESLTSTSKKASVYKPRSNTAKSLFGGTQTPQAVHEVVAAIGSSLIPKTPNTQLSDVENVFNEVKTSQQTVQDTAPKCIGPNLDDGMCTPGENRLERLTKAWIREFCIAEAGAISSRGDIYANYVEHIRKNYNICSGSLQMFINQLKICFPLIVIKHAPGSSIQTVEGIRFIKEKSINEKIENSNSEKISEKEAVVAQHPLMQKILSNNSTTNEWQNLTSSINGYAICPNNNGIKMMDDLNEHNKYMHSNNIVIENSNNLEITNGKNEKFNSKLLSECSDKLFGLNGNSKVVENNNSAGNSVNGFINYDNMKNSLQKNEQSSEENIESVAEFIKNSNSLNGVFPSKGKKRATTTNGTPKPNTKKSKLMNKVYVNTSTANNSSISKPQIFELPSLTSLPESLILPSTSTATGYMCEWECCGRFLNSDRAMLFHNTQDHVKIRETKKNSESELLICRWPFCDGTPRSKWSMVTHLQDHHCSDAYLQAAQRKRLEMGHLNYMSSIRKHLEKIGESGHHPGYSEFAAQEAIRRNAFAYLPKELTDDTEGPVTKSIRLTSSLILRNISKHSVEGRRQIRKHEGHLSWLSLSRLESAGILAQCLSELKSKTR